MSKWFKKISVVSIVIGMLTACASQPTTGPNYYLLSSGELTSQALQLKPFKLALGPIEVPVHLDREGIATLDGQNQLNYADNHRWAEPLTENLTKTLHANLAQLLPDQQLIDFPYRQANRPNYQLSVSIEKFGYVTDGSVVLKARSIIVNAKGRQLDSNHINLKRLNIEQDYALIVSTMSDLLKQMAVDLATRLSEKV